MLTTHAYGSLNPPLRYLFLDAFFFFHSYFYIYINILQYHIYIQLQFIFSIIKKCHSVSSISFLFYNIRLIFFLHHLFKPTTIPFINHINPQLVCALSLPLRVSFFQELILIIKNPNLFENQLQKCCIIS